MNDYPQIMTALGNYFNALNELKKLDLIPNQKDFTGQIGEWLVAALFNGKRAENGIQKDWDIQADGKRIQVKTHAKAETTNAPWSPIQYNPQAEIDILVIVVFSHNYKIEKLIHAPWDVVIERISRQKHRDVINWSQLNKYEVNLNSLVDKRDIIALFK